MVKNLFFGFAMLLGLALSSLSFAADVFEKIFPYDYGEFEGEFKEGKKWQEDKLSLPDYPNDDDLLEFVGPPGNYPYTYALDEKSLTIGKDGVVRYVVVITSRSGSRNIYYQGISCSKKQMKQFAYVDSSRKKFIAATDPQWQRFSRSGALGFSDNLASFYFCNPFDVIFTRDEIISKLKYGQGDSGSEYD